MSTPSRAVILTHGGAGNDEAAKDGCERACAAGLDVLHRGGSAREAATAAVVVLEDDPRMNAGTGSVMRIDGGVIECDAAVMDHDGFGATAALQGFKNPVLLAAHIYALPHMLVVGEGARALAERLGLVAADLSTDAAREKHAARAGTLAQHSLWQGQDIARVFGRAVTDGNACDTVGAIVRDAHGRFAAASSTGGIWCALRGRVGDAPIPGAGIYVGEAGAVVATGIGELIWKEMLALRVHDALARGATADEALADALARYKDRASDVDIGVLVVGKKNEAGGATRRMPFALAHAAL
jgi:beta-aspartyl-peptidase (threonine type)